MKRTGLFISIFICLLLFTALGISAGKSDFINVSTNRNGEYDIYTVPQSVSAGYRYGPSYIVNGDGSIDAWFAASGSSIEQWDWIMYKHFDGESWSEEKCVLQPTPNGFDHYSCCDPGVIYLNGYYYLTYTSTMNYDQTDNSLFVARSQNPDGPYEKWNGKGWGGYSPKPLIAFSEDSSFWGIGEASMTEVGGILYLYYTENGSKGHSTALVTADANDENWPQSLEFRGYVLENTTSDAIDVKYVEKFEKFIAVASDERMTDNSYLVFYESNDGLRFRMSDICKKDVFAYCHNPGLSGDGRGHITEGMRCFVSYAYGKGWGVWNTRVLPIDISISDRIDRSEQYTASRAITSFARDTRDPSSLDITAISPQTKCVIRASSQSAKIKLTVNYCTAFRDKWKSISSFGDEVMMYGYDESVIKRIGSSMEFEVVGAGDTMITIELRGHITYVYVFIYDISNMADIKALLPAGGSEFYITDRCGSDELQIKSVLYYNDGTLDYILGNQCGLLNIEYDGTAIKIYTDGHITPIKTGLCSVRVSYGEIYYELTVNISGHNLSYKGFPDVKGTGWYYEGVRYCYEKGYISGTDKGLFMPDSTLTREQLVVILARIDGVKLSYYTDSPFNDVKSGSWYAPAVSWAYKGGYVNGVGNNDFGVGRAITREELAVLLHRYSLDMSIYPQKIYSYHDWGKISSWASDSVNWAVVKGILSSTDTKIPTLSPKMTVTRAQAAKIFMAYDGI